jgi:hypothetical protein
MSVFAEGALAGALADGTAEASFLTGETGGFPFPNTFSIIKS